MSDDLVKRLEELGSRPAVESTRGMIGSYIDAVRKAAARIRHLEQQVETTKQALAAIRFNLVQAGYAVDSIMIEGIDAAIRALEEQRPTL